jgi:hypothetical protein
VSDSPAGVVILHPSFDKGKRFHGVRDWGDTDVVALESFDEGHGHAVALWTFDRGEARREIERHGDLDRPMSGEDRAIVR